MLRGPEDPGEMQEALFFDAHRNISASHMIAVACFIDTSSCEHYIYYHMGLGGNSIKKYIPLALQEFQHYFIYPRDSWDF